MNTEQNTNTSHSQYITSLKINPAGNTIITGYVPSLLCIVLSIAAKLTLGLWLPPPIAGSGDGTIGLFDIRACSAISHLSVGSGSEVVFLMLSISYQTYWLFCVSVVLRHFLLIIFSWVYS